MVARKARDEDGPEGALEDTDDVEVDEEEDGDEVAAGLAVAAEGDDGDGDDGDDETSLEDLLAQRGSARRAPGESDEDEDEDIMALSSERDPSPNEEIRTKVIPIKARQEFVCKRCYLVKARSQMADEDRILCRDCV